MSESPSIKESAVSFLQLAATGRAPEAFERFAAAGFKHHNPWFRSDAQSLMNAMQENVEKNPGKVLEVQRAIQEGLLVAVHSRVRQRPEDPGGSVVHIFRFEGEKIAELWDIGQAQPEQMVNENGMF
jgi:predicted SnoaL-like aldol condensation-catalyzing enzyme